MLIAKEDGLLKRDKKADRGKSKEEIKEEDEKVLRQVGHQFCTLILIFVCNFY